MRLRNNIAPIDVPTAIAIVEPWPPEGFWGGPVEMGKLTVGLDLRPNELDNAGLGFNR